MIIKKLSIENLRLFDKVELKPEPRINIITGNNGAGKTSLLEAIYLLGRGRSFRHKEAGPFIKEETEQSRILAELESDAGNLHRLGIQRSVKSIKARLDGEDIHKRSELMQAIPLQIITPLSHELIEKGPENRRRFMDYNMFHVEQDNHVLLATYLKTLKQRNSALRQNKLEVARSFNAMMVKTAVEIHRRREEYVSLLDSILQKMITEMDLTFGISVQLKPGWNMETGLEEVLKRDESKDLKLGYSSAGAHRAELRIESAGRLAGKRLSRGQQKMLIYLMNLAQIELTGKEGKEKTVLLIDDLAAELDTENMNKTISRLASLEIQVFITSVSAKEIQLPGSTKMFHVEQGEVCVK